MKKIDKFQQAQDVLTLSNLCYYRDYDFKPSQTFYSGGASMRISGGSKLHFVLNDPAELDTVVRILGKYGFCLLGHKYWNRGAKMTLTFDMPEDSVKFVKKIKPRGIGGFIRRNTLPLIIKLAEALDDDKTR